MTRGCGTMEGMASPSGLAAHAAQFDRWLRVDALPLWAGAGYDRIGFLDGLNPDASPAPLPRRLRVQARQTWVFAQAGLTGWDGPWRERMAAGLEVMASRYRRAGGGYRALLSPHGAVLGGRHTLYDQTFGLLALPRPRGAGAARR